MRALVAMLLLLLVNALAPASAAIGGQEVVGEPAIVGYVLAPDGTPVSGGAVVARSGFFSTSASIDGTGRFRLVPRRTGSHQLLVTVPGLPPYRATLNIPDSRSMRLPVIRLVSGAYFRVRLVSPEGEPITAPRLRGRVFDASGQPIVDGLDDRISDSADNDGATTIGPLPRGIMSVAVDMPLFAQTRLPDVNVGEEARVVDGGTITIQQPGGVLHVDVLDGIGAPVPNHEVRLTDPRPRSPLVFPPVRSNQQGRATFDRLAAGRYRVSATAADRCANVVLSTSRVAALSGSGAVEMPLVVGGRATFRVTLPFGPARGVEILASPDVPPPPVPFAYRSSPVGCRGTTDADGRVTLTNFPPGPARIDVRMTNSTYIRQIAVPSDNQEVAIVIPDGLLSVHVVNAVTNQAVSGATITWTGRGARVEATSTAAGDALLEGVGTARGTLAASAHGYQSAEEPLTEPPALPHTIALTPLPPTPNLRVRVVTPSGEPLRNAVVELISANPAAVPRIASTDGKGVVTFSDVPSGSLQLIAHGDRFVTSTMRVGEDPPSEIVFTLSRGYRAIASVELPATAGPQIVRVTNDENASMDSFLDSESDRRVDPPGRLSLGPLAPGAYVIELHGAGGRRTERIRIVDRDVYATLR
ncbi:MAG TPA: carboxypeptidase-like regulatory domain-containing protein [Vicinamibacterales bacterium]|nr:carboxypeptidase-like regulatory domain-containing protein [Vicinamibacterales bacterium]